MKWHYLILDEAQAIKNYRSQRWMRIAEFPSQRRLLLTGTPMQNSLEEVWALLHFLAPELFESLNMFQQLFSNLTAMSEGRKPQDQAIVKQLHTVCCVVLVFGIMLLILSLACDAGASSFHSATLEVRSGNPAAEKIRAGFEVSIVETAAISV
jgi:SNF2 family DNA or RNA helicase